MNIRKLVFTVILTGILMGLSAPSSAITSGELLEEESKYISHYLAGLVDMLAYTQFVGGNERRGNCIYDWYYRTDGSIEKIYRYLEKYSDKQPEAIIIVLAKRPCPLSD